MDNPTYPPTAIVAISIVLPLLTVVAVYLRFYVRLRVQPNYLGIDDWMAAIASIFCLGDGANLIVGTTLGVTGRIWADTVPAERTYISNKSDYAQVIIEKPLYALMKLSALFFFRRIFYYERAFTIANTIMIVVIILWSLAFLLAEIFVCGRYEETLWRHDGHAGSCVNQTWLNLWFAITDVVTDVAVMSLPYPVIAALGKLSRRERAGVMAVFMLGAISTVAGIVRLGFISKAFTEDFGSSGNTRGAGTPPAVWSTVEGSVGVLAICLPPLAPLMRNMGKYLSVRSLMDSIHNFFRSGDKSLKK